MVLTVLSLRRTCERSLVPNRSRDDTGPECSGAQVVELVSKILACPCSPLVAKTDRASARVGLAPVRPHGPVGQRAARAVPPRRTRRGR
jgi:hypothetical protein